LYMGGKVAHPVSRVAQAKTVHFMLESPGYIVLSPSALSDAKGGRQRGCPRQRTKTESDRTVSRGASDVHWGVWIQTPTLLEPREVVRTAANMRVIPKKRRPPRGWNECC